MPLKARKIRFQTVYLRCFLRWTARNCVIILTVLFSILYQLHSNMVCSLETTKKGVKCNKLNKNQMFYKKLKGKTPCSFSRHCLKLKVSFSCNHYDNFMWFAPLWIITVWIKLPFRLWFAGIPRIFTDDESADVSALLSQFSSEEDHLILDYIRNSRININIRQVN